jgi:hypothetical protein
MISDREAPLKFCDAESNRFEHILRDEVIGQERTIRQDQAEPSLKG